MNNLNNGTLTIEGIEVNQDTKLDFFEKSLATNPNFEVRKRQPDKATVGSLRPIQLGSKRFSVRISFENNIIKGIRLKVSDSSINQWDYEEKLSQHGEWLTEQIGYPEGILSENVFEWGKITQWYDPWSSDAGISILYFQR
ncbi:hypothetical protein IFT92_10130 [Peribacillus simplex]|uniref:hypothetical protein n=1 Tax=Bacillaceae TaxID=186817 RepID=UPI00065F7FCF|nr:MULTISPECIES: hypothetical protein [Bacillaceae]MCP1095110.1 hypothetical protein [Bacillaceae bacterium OS4b]MBD8588167.1 hypothetical protein [Peribacillus simplex]MCF7620644.1 hypothetical protein [Peribacillus frigoritolerans]MEA3575075.1 hypothetical protein [Peribacillus frigoritolerans]PRA73898.1 hypothetical protein CQ056_27555 [Peribacillus simplex]